MLWGTGRLVVLTGGKNPLTGAGEAAAHLQIVLGRGVPRERIIAETGSTNTLENVTLALPAIAEHINVRRIESVVVVTKWYHCRRAMMTLKRHPPAGIRYYAATYEPKDVSRSNWWQGEAGYRRVIKERDRIPKYLPLGDMEAVREENGAFV
jgi:uncharacterized SAM-binding protein YcdF (DUF218 family)